MRGLAIMLMTLLIAPSDVTPTRLREVSKPLVPPQLYGQCKLLFEASVDETGRVSTVVPLSREPLSAVVVAAVERWRFDPALTTGEARPQRVLVAAVFRPPTLMNVEPSVEPPPEASALAGDLPAPTSMPAPSYPANALGGDTVVVEAKIGADGSVASARAVGRATAFDGVSIAAARQWRFRPARDAGPVPRLAYMIFGFAAPALSPPLPR